MPPGSPGRTTEQALLEMIYKTNGDVAGFGTWVPALRIPIECFRGAWVLGSLC